jgi:uncharacterized protein YdaU (DUF1376 family)
MKWWVKDYLADTMSLSAREHGAYLLLLAHMWISGGSLRLDPAGLARMARVTPEEWPEIWARIGPFFRRRGAVLRQKRLTFELEQLRDRSRRHQEAGRKGGLARRGNDSGNRKAPLKPGSSPVKPGSTILQNQNQKQEATTVASISSGSEAIASSPSPRRPTKICPADFEPDATVYRVAEEMGLPAADVARELATMRDHQFRDARKDWQAVARNWLRKAQPRNGGRQANLSFAAQDMLIEAEGNRRFIELMETRDDDGSGGGHRHGTAGAGGALPGKTPGA